MSKPTELWKRDQQAASDPLVIPPGPSSSTETTVSGVCKITADGDDGTYTVTQQIWDDSAGAWVDASEPQGFAGLTANDISTSTAGSVDDIVQFWYQFGDEGEQTLFIAVPVAGGGGGSTISVSEDEGTPIDDVDTLNFNYIEVTDDGGGQATVSLPDGGSEMFAMLGWDSYDERWIKACDGPGIGDEKQLYIDGSLTVSWKDAHFKHMSIDGTVYSGISVVDVHHNTVGDASGPILVTSAGAGTHPERTVDLIIAHTAIFGSQQNIDVRNAAGTGTTTLKFDKYGHFIGT